jgi:hypothetical protein
LPSKRDILAGTTQTAYLEPKMESQPSGTTPGKGGLTKLNSRFSRQWIPSQQPQRATLEKGLQPPGEQPRTNFSLLKPYRYGKLNQYFTNDQYEEKKNKKPLQLNQDCFQQLPMQQHQFMDI